MKMYAVLKANCGRVEDNEPFVTNVCTLKSAAVNAAEHQLDDFISDYNLDPADGPLEVTETDTYKTAFSQNRAYGIVVKVQELNFDITINA